MYRNRMHRVRTYTFFFSTYAYIDRPMIANITPGQGYMGFKVIRSCWLKGQIITKEFLRLWVFGTDVQADDALRSTGVYML